MTAVRRLALLWVVLVAVMGAACATTGGAVPRPFPGAALPPAPAPLPPIPEGDASPPELVALPSPGPEEPPSPPLFDPPVREVPGIVATTLALMGIPYRNGGTDPGGFDCSGLVQWVFNKFGTFMPRNTREQYQVGTDISRDDLQPGDLVFFATAGRRRVSHVGIVVSPGHFVHAPNSKGYVRMERLEATYWSKRFLGARRVPLATASTNAD